MARYHFDIHNGDGPTSDAVGMELSSRAEVLAEAGKILSDIARDEIPGHDRISIVLKVRDERGVPIFISSLSFMAEWLDDMPK